MFSFINNKRTSGCLPGEARTSTAPLSTARMASGSGPSTDAPGATSPFLPHICLCSRLASLLARLGDPGICSPLTKPSEPIWKSKCHGMSLGDSKDSATSPPAHVVPGGDVGRGFPTPKRTLGHCPPPPGSLAALFSALVCGVTLIKTFISSPCNFHLLLFVLVV